MQQVMRKKWQNVPKTKLQGGALTILSNKTRATSEKKCQTLSKTKLQGGTWAYFVNRWVQS